MQAMNSESQPVTADSSSAAASAATNQRQQQRSSIATCTAQESQSPQPMAQSRIARRRGISAPPRFIMPSDLIENDEDLTLEGNQKIDDILDSGLKHLEETMHRISSNPSLQFQQEFDKSIDQSLDKSLERTDSSSSSVFV